MCCMRDIKNVFITRTSYGRVWCWLGKPLKTLLEKVSSAKWTLQRMRHEGAIDIQKKSASISFTEDHKEQNAVYTCCYIYITSMISYMPSWKICRCCQLK